MDIKINIVMDILKYLCNIEKIEEDEDKKTIKILNDKREKSTIEQLNKNIQRCNNDYGSNKFMIEYFKFFWEFLQKKDFILKIFYERYKITYEQEEYKCRKFLDELAQRYSWKIDVQKELNKKHKIFDELFQIQD